MQLDGRSLCLGFRVPLKRTIRVPLRDLYGFRGLGFEDVWGLGPEFVFTYQWGYWGLGFLKGFYRV